MKLKTRKSPYEVMLEPEISKAGYQCVDVTFEKKGKNWILTAYIDKKGGVNLEDCEKVSRKLSEFLDEKDPIEQSYILEVSSPGLDRPFKTETDFVRNIDRKVFVKLYAAKENRKEFSSTLSDYQDGVATFTLEDGEEIRLTVEEIASVIPEIEF
ncbi:MAG: ribosome maturation factor RimP [Eubacteriaceae bacterium]|nr:ribosome maturation factor RimP [Eubacteriaceae bacterium]